MERYIKEKDRFWKFVKEKEGEIDYRTVTKWLDYIKETIQL